MTLIDARLRYSVIWNLSLGSLGSFQSPISIYLFMRCKGCLVQVIYYCCCLPYILLSCLFLGIRANFCPLLCLLLSFYVSGFLCRGFLCITSRPAPGEKKEYHSFFVGILRDLKNYVRCPKKKPSSREGIVEKVEPSNAEAAVGNNLMTVDCGIRLL